MTETSSVSFHERRIAPPSQEPRPRAGRPTREQAERRHQQLLDEALEIFLDKGFELSTIEAIAEAVGMTKRTVYARYPDKGALFQAAVQRAVELYFTPVEALHGLETDDLEETLIAIARARLDNAISPVGLKLARILNAESYRFPELYRLVYDQMTRAAIFYIGDLFARHGLVDGASKDEAELLGVTFLNTVIGGPARVIAWGATYDDAELDKRIRYCVHIFLNGLLPR